MNRRKHDNHYIAFTIFMLICTAAIFYSVGYEAAARHTAEIVTGAK